MKEYRVLAKNGDHIFVTEFFFEATRIAETTGGSVASFPLEHPLALDGWCCMACCEAGYTMDGHWACKPTPLCGQHEPDTHGELR